MTDPFLAQARINLTEAKRWGRVSEKAILAGYWDAGQLVREQLDALLKERPEVIDE